MALCRGCPTTWFALFNPEVNKAVRKLAQHIKHPNSIRMSYSSDQTVDLLGDILDVLKERKATTAQAVQKADEAIAALEPLRAENSRVNTAIEALVAEKEVWLRQDEAEDAALKAIVDHIEEGKEVPPVDPPAGPPVDPPAPEDPPVDPPVKEESDPGAEDDEDKDLTGVL